MEAIKVNLIPNGIPETCHASQYDEGRQIRLDLFDGLTPYTIQAGDTFTLNVRKPDNHVITETVTGTEGNTYLVIDTTEQMTAVTGENLCEIRLENNGDNIGSLNFIMQVEKDVIANGIPSESVIEDLEALVVEAVGDNYYTKTETDALLSQKADVTDLLDLLPTDTASGAVANFTDGADDVPVKALSVEFAATQAEGTPTPAAPIPIVGVDKVNVTRTQNNIFTSPIERGNINAYGENTDNLNPNRSRTAKQIAVSPSTEYTVGNAENYKVGIFYYTSNGTFISYLTWDDTPRTFTTPSNCAFVRFAYQNTSGTYPTKNQLCKGTTLDNYDQTVVTALINLGGTYYGGSVDAVTGKITLDRKIVDMGDLSWSYVPSNNLFSSNVIADMDVLPWNTELQGKFLCECGNPKAKNTAWSNLSDFEFGTLNGAIRFKDSNFTDPALFKANISGNKIMYPLATPIVVYASNTAEITTILGVNNIFSDAGDVDVTIRADIALYIQKMLGGNANRSLAANPSILRTGAISTDIEVREPLEPDSEPVELEREVTEQPENEGNNNEER